MCNLARQGRRRYQFLSYARKVSILRNATQSPHQVVILHRQGDGVFSALAKSESHRAQGVLLRQYISNQDDGFPLQMQYASTRRIQDQIRSLLSKRGRE